MKALPKGNATGLARLKTFLILLIFSVAVFFTGALAEKMSGLLEGVKTYLPNAVHKIKCYLQEKVIFKIEAAYYGGRRVGVFMVYPTGNACFIRGP